ncbi:MAG: BACON domain-containing protein, partial [Bacteroides sp.]
AEEVKQEVTVKQAGASITVTPAEDVTLPATGETKAEYFTVTSTRAWYVTSSNAAWNVLDRTEGTGGDTKVTLKAEMNPSTAERSTKLSFTLVGAEGLKQEVTIKQAGSSITVTPAEDVTLPAAGDTKAEYFTVKSTGAWKVTSSNTAWNVLDKSEGAAGETKVTLKTEMNPSTAERSTKLTFVLVGAEEVKQEVMVKQAGKSTPPKPSDPSNPSKPSDPSNPSDPSKPSTPLAVESAPLASIVVAPNPFSAQLQIINDAWVEGQYELLTASGVVVRSGVLQGRETVLNTVELRSGGYLLRLLVGKEQKTIFVVKE